ncbi:MAG: DUF1097 family protein [Planctomycetota bacterium]|jgi:hypothetical protein|nr:DUF1097 family protein [Planctomycetota bacterium]
MSKKVVVLWCLWIGLVVALFAFAYLASPLAKYGVMWMSFVSMPLYFAAGAELKDLASFCATNIAGLVWGLFYLFLIGVFSKLGLSAPLATAATITIATPSCCIAHMLVPDKYLVNKLAAAFGAIACVFSQNGGNLVPTGLTLVAGVVVGLLCKAGLGFFQKPARAEA